MGPPHPVEGVVVGETLGRISIRRETAEAGVVCVHFPKWGYRIDLADP